MIQKGSSAKIILGGELSRYEKVVYEVSTQSDVRTGKRKLWNDENGL